MIRCGGDAFFARDGRGGNRRARAKLHRRRPIVQLDRPVHRTRCAIHVDALMSAVPACDVAEGTTDTRLLVDVGHDLVVQVEMLPLGDASDGQAAKILECGKAFGAHPVLESLGHVFDDAIAVVHHRRADLNRPSTQQHELHRVTPG